MSADNFKPTGNLEYALEYIKRDWKIFPLFYVLKDGTCSCKQRNCKRVGKHPLIKNGVLNADNDEAKVRQWWTEHKYANIGLATGHGGLIVVDVDSGLDKKTGLPKVGPASLRALEDANGKLPKTLTVRTGSGGRHLYFLSTREIKNSQDKLGKHLDVGGHGGYVILPGSNHETGNKYEWDGSSDAAIADMPEWLERLLSTEASGVDVSEDFDEKQDAEIEKALKEDKFRPEQLVRLLDFIPADCDRDVWWQIGAALKKELGDKRGWEVWKGWSEKYTDPKRGWDEKTGRVQWDSFRPDAKGANGKTISGGTIYHYAKTLGEFRGFDVEAADAPEIKESWIYATSIKRFVETNRLLEWDKEQFDAIFSPLFTRGKPSEHVLKNESFRRVEGVTYWPNERRFVTEINGHSCLNYWRPSDVTPAPGDATPFLDHVRYLFPDGDEGEILLDYLAHQVQRPGEKVHWAVLLVGDQGNGKSYFATVMRLVLGAHNVNMVNNAELHETFTKWQRNTQFVIVEELMAKGRLELMDKLKPIITESWCTIREMYRPPYEQPNRFNFLFFSNHDNALLLDKGDRRYCILKTDAPPHPDRNAYYGPLFDWTRQNGPALAHYLANRPLGHFQPKAHAPVTEGKKAMIRASMLPIDQFICDQVEAQEHPFRWDIFKLADLVQPLLESGNRVNTKEIGNAFQRLGYKQIGRVRLTGERPHMWAVRNFERYEEMSEDQLRGIYQLQVGSGFSDDPNGGVDPTVGQGALLKQGQRSPLLDQREPNPVMDDAPMTVEETPSEDREGPVKCAEDRIEDRVSRSP